MPSPRKRVLSAATCAGVTCSFLAGLLVAPVTALGAQVSRNSPPRPTTPTLQLPERPLSQILRVSGVKTVIGTEDEAGPLLFGQITGVAIDGGGTVYVADYPVGEIRAFDARGRHLSTFGRRGRGPGEFVSPIQLVHDGDSTMFAVQPFLGVTELTAKDGRISLRRTFGVTAGFTSFCFLDGRTFAATGGDSALVRELDGERRVIRSFGAPIHSQDNAAIRAFANRSGAALTCDEATGTLYAVSTDMGVVRSYAVNGTLRWQTTLPDFRHAIYGANPGGGVYVAWSIDFISSVQPIEGRRLLVHVGSLDFASTGRAGRAARGAQGGSIQPEITRRISYLIDAPSGRLLSKSADGSALITFRDSLAAEWVTNPWPMVRLRTVGLPPR